MAKMASKPGGEPAMQPETGRSRLVATDDRFGQSHLLLGPHQKLGRLEGLRRLRLGPVEHPDHYNTGRVDIQRQLDLLVLRLGLGGSFACDLLSASLRVRTAFVRIHVLVDVATSLSVRQHSCHLSVP